MALRRSRVRIPLGPQKKNKPLYLNDERFVLLLHFEDRVKLDGLGIDQFNKALLEVVKGMIFHRKYHIQSCRINQIHLDSSLISD